MDVSYPSWELRIICFDLFGLGQELTAPYCKLIFAGVPASAISSLLNCICSYSW